MKNIPEVKIGIVVGSTDWMPAEIAIEQRKILYREYVQTYGDSNVYECQVCVNDNEINLKRVVKEIDKAECNALCIYFANYGPESAGTLLANEFDGPVMLIGAAEDGSEPLFSERKDSLSGFINACYATKLRKTNVYIPSKPIGTLSECVESIHRFVSISKVTIGLRDLKLLSIGPRPASYLAANAPNSALYDLGIDISEYSELELFDAYLKHADDTRINSVVEEMSEELNIVNDVSLLSMAQYELTVKDWIRSHKGNRQYVTMTSTCWPAFPVKFGFVPCYVNSRITDNGIPIACEVDEYGAVSEFIGQCISEKTVTILNVNNNIPLALFNEKIKEKSFNGKKYEIDDLFLGYHCGVTGSSKLKKASYEKHFVNNQLIGEEKSCGTVQGELNSGPVTLLRIQCDRNGELMAYVAQGQILPVDIDTYGGRGIIAVPQMSRFIKNVIIDNGYPNHVAVIFGHYGEILFDTLRYLGIKNIDYNHPQNIPYLLENYFSNNSEWY